MYEFIHYDTTDGSKWRARIESVTVSTVIGIVFNTPDPHFEHFAEPTNARHTDRVIKYITADGSKWKAKIVGKSTLVGPTFYFLHAPIDDSSWSRAHEDGKIIYISNGGTVNRSALAWEHLSGNTWKVGFQPA